MNRFAFSLRDGLAVVLVISLVLAGYRLGKSHGHHELDAARTAAVEEIINDRLFEWSKRPSDWEHLRGVVQSHSPWWGEAASKKLGDRRISSTLSE